MEGPRGGSLVRDTAVVSFAADVNIGTWKVNVAKSKNLPSDDKNTTTAITPVGENVKVAIDGVDAVGKPFHDERTGKFDGKDYNGTKIKAAIVYDKR